MIVREMSFEDLEEVMVIENETFSAPWTETGYFTFLIRDDTLFLVAEDDGIVGYCGVVMAQDEGDITNVAVRKDRRRQNIGTRLMEELIRQTSQAGVKKLFLEVRKGNEKAISLYKKMGFEKCGLRKNYYQDPVEDAILMKHEEMVGNDSSDDSHSL